MKLIVQKYGGSSVATVEKIKNVARKIVAAKKDGNHVLAVEAAEGTEVLGFLHPGHLGSVGADSDVVELRHVCGP